MVTHKKYILASSSKSRYKILTNSGFIFKQVSPLCDEEAIKEQLKNKKTRPDLFAKKLSFEKAKSVSINKKHFHDYVIGCDTLIHINNNIYDKAKNFNEAKKKLQKLSGKKHKIISGLTICKGGEKIWQCSESTTVKVKKLMPSQINNYLRAAGPQILQSVGCYQIESLGPNIIEYIKGDFFNVMGLPLFSLFKYLSKKI